ncbi:MAG: L,D-transpeptidase family protein [Chthoniobacter sp.]
MQEFPHKVKGAFVALLLFASLAAADEVVPYVPTVSIVVSIPEQKLLVLRDGGLWKKYPISTSKFGIGDSYGSYKTPVGQLRVCEKIGEELAAGSVIKQRHATGEVLPANAPGRDPIVTRILWLDGLEEQNHNARSRGIYIHGTTEEGKIGKPVSYGCIRMRSQDVLEVFEEATIDTPVSIIPDKFPKYAKYVPPKPKIIAVVAPPKATPAPAKLAANAKPATSTPAPAPAIASVPTNPPKKAASGASVPPAVAEYHPPAVEPAVSHSSVTVSAVSNSVVAHAMQGSILSAGLPDGPKIPTLPDPPAPKGRDALRPARSESGEGEGPHAARSDPQRDAGHASGGSGGQRPRGRREGAGRHGRHREARVAPGLSRRFPRQQIQAVGALRPAAHRSNRRTARRNWWNEVWFSCAPFGARPRRRCAKGRSEDCQRIVRPVNSLNCCHPSNRSVAKQNAEGAEILERGKEALCGPRFSLRCYRKE